jgi:hypothetical protein
MARVKPNLFSAVSGRLGAVEFAMTRGGIVAKHRKPPRQLNHPKQVEARTVFARRVSDWHQMTPEAMLEWTAWANTHPVVNRLGRTIYLSGYNWFLKCLGSEDGILLPYGITPPVTNLQAVVVEDALYAFTMDFPAGCEDETIVWVCFLEYPYELNFDWTSATAAWYLQYTKATIGDLDYAHLTAAGVEFHAGHDYEIRIWIQRPRYFSSDYARLVFPCVPAQPWAMHLTMDDNTDTPVVLDEWMHYAQTFEGLSPNTDDHHVAGVHDGALHFDGVTDHIDLTPESYESYLDVDQPFTIAMWWKPDVPMGHGIQYFLGGRTSGFAGVYFQIRDTDSFVACTFLYLGTNYAVSYNWVIPEPGDWIHYALVRNGTNVRMFRNGVKALDETLEGYQGAAFTEGNPMSIGCRIGTDLWAAGACDDVYLFDHALSDAEVAALAVP